jgi:hypothetical protein
MAKLDTLIAELDRMEAMIATAAHDHSLVEVLPRLEKTWVCLFSLSFLRLSDSFHLGMAGVPVQTVGR